MPVSTVFENLQDMSIDELVEEFGATREQGEAVLQFVAQTAEAPASQRSVRVAVAPATSTPPLKLPLAT